MSGLVVIKLVLVSVIAGSTWLLTRDLGWASFAGLIAWTVISMLLGLPGPEEALRRRATAPEGPSRLVRFLATVIQVVLVITVPAVLVRLFAGALPESWRALAKLLIVIAVFAIPFEGLLDRLIKLTKQPSAPRRGA